ncbi:MAG: hypothetical protein ACLGH3_04780, partial [Actinomycetota bacterium]
MPRADDMEWIEFTDFSPGIFSNNNLAGGVEVTSTNPAMAQETGTYRCMALPTGGLGPLPRLSASYRLTTIPEGGNGYTYQVAGFGTWGRILNSPVADASSVQVEAHIAVYYDYPDGLGTYTAKWNWLRERLFDTAVGTETILNKSLATTGNSNARYTYFLKTRMNPVTPTSVGTPVMVCIGSRVANNDIIVSRAWPDPSAASTNGTIIVGDAGEADPYVVAAAHQGRIVLAAFQTFSHGVDASLVTNENFYWTDTNDNTLVSVDPAQFVPELDQSISDMAPMSANMLFVVKWYGGGYVLQGDLSDVTVVQLPNIPCPDGSDYVRGVNTSKGFLYSAGNAGMYLWNGGDGAELVSGQLEGNFAVGDNFISGPNGQCDRWIDKVLVPRNWMFDTERGSWWRIEDPSVVDIRFWSTTSYTSYALGAETSFTDAAPKFMHLFRYDDLAYSYSWQSHPLWV